MSADADVVRAYCNAWMRGDTAAVAALYHDDLTLTWPGDHRLAGDHAGLDAAVAALVDLQAITNRVPVEIVDVLEGDRSIVVTVVERWTADGDETSIDVRRALDYTVADGKLRTCRIYEGDQPAIDAWIGPATQV